MRVLAEWMICAAAAACAAASPDVRLSTARNCPAPSSLAAEVAVDGRTSELVGRLDVVRTRRPGPDALYSGDFVGDSDGFGWYVSRHYALKTDVGDEAAAEALALLELGWPQLRAVFGSAPPRSDTLRMALVLASGRAALRRAMIDDALYVPLQGGLMQEGYVCAYLYAGTPYQTRYILLHEAAHLFQYGISGDTKGCRGFFVEGVADFFSSHVYDPAARRLVVNVLDRAPIHNHLSAGLEEWGKRGRPSFSTLCGEAEPSRGVSVLLTAFLQSTPAYEAKWRRLCEGVVRSGGLPARGSPARLVGELYGGAAALDAPFAAWLETLAPSYRLLGREFDQEGDEFVSAYPAAGEAPAALALPKVGSRRGGFVRDWPCPQGLPARAPGVAYRLGLKWGRPPSPGSFAAVSFAFDGGGPFLECAVSNAPSGRLAFFEVNGVRDPSASTRRLPARLEEGVAVEVRPEGEGRLAVALLAGGGEVARVVAALPGGMRAADFFRARPTVVASEPGIRLRPDEPAAEPPAGPLPAGARFPSASVRTAAPVSAKPASGAPIEAWRVLGPFARSGAPSARASFNPVGSAPDADAVFELDDGSLAMWRAAALNRSSAASAPIVNFARVFGRQANRSVAYAWATVDAPEARRATLSLGVADAVEVFVNGRAVRGEALHGGREWADANASFCVELQKGRNEIVLRLTHETGSWLLSGNLL